MSSRRKRPANDPTARPSASVLASQSQHGRRRPSASQPSGSRPAPSPTIVMPNPFPGHESSHASGWQPNVPPPPPPAPLSQHAQQGPTRSQLGNSRPPIEPTMAMSNLFQAIDPRDIDRKAPNTTPSIAAESSKLEDYVCPLCWTVIGSGTAGFKTHIRERHTGTRVGVFKGSKYRHACGFCCAVFESSAQWVNHVIQLSCTPDQGWLVVNQILGILRNALSNPTTVTVESHYDFNCCMNGFKPNPAAETPQANFKEILTTMETEYSISTDILRQVAALLKTNQICLHQVEDRQYIVTPDSELCTQCTPANMQTSIAEQTMKRGLIPLTTPTPSEAAPKHARLASKHSDYTNIQSEQPMEPSAASVMMPTSDEAEIRTYACPVCGTTNNDKKETLWLHMQKEHPDYRYPCPKPDCNKSYKHEKTLNAHVKVHEGIKQPRQYKKPPKPQEPRPPPICPVVDCKHYNKLFANYTNLDMHFKKMHSELGLVAVATTDQRPLTCPVPGCEYYDKPFSQLQAKDRHMERKHPGVDLDSLEEQAALQRRRGNHESASGSVEEST